MDDKELKGLLDDVDGIIDGTTVPAHAMMDSVERDSATIQSRQELVSIGEHYDFPPKLAFEYALSAESHQSLRDRYRLSEAEFTGLQSSPAFLAYVATFKKDIAEFGLGFRMRARVHAESALDIAMDMARTEDTPPAVRATLLAQVVKWADLEPVKKANETESVTVNLQINV